MNSMIFKINFFLATLVTLILCFFIFGTQKASAIVYTQCALNGGTCILNSGGLCLQACGSNCAVTQTWDGATNQLGCGSGYVCGCAGNPPYCNSTYYGYFNDSTRTYLDAGAYTDGTGYQYNPYYENCRGTATYNDLGPNYTNVNWVGGVYCNYYNNPSIYYPTEGTLWGCYPVEPKYSGSIWNDSWLCSFANGNPYVACYLPPGAITACNSSNSTNVCGACSATNTLGTNYCGYVSGSESCTYEGDWCQYTANTVSCKTFYNNCKAPFNQVGTSPCSCEKTMGGRVTDADTGNGIDGVVIAGGGTTAGGGYWTVNNTTNNMAYNTSFTFTAPTATTVTPCNSGYECGNGSPNPGSYTGTVGGTGDCGMNCNFVYTPGKISGHVWIDTNHNGVQDNGEANAGAGVLVQDTAGDYTYTDSNGNYLFNYLSSTTYTVYVHNFPGYKTITSPQTLTIPPNRVNINFGIAPAYSVSGYVFTDWNYNNVFDAEDNSFIPPPAVNVTTQQCPSACQVVGNVPVISDVNMTLQNPSFETAGTPASGWNFYVTAPAVATANQDTTTSSGGTGNTSSLHVNVTTADPGYFWYVNLLQPNLSLTQDTAYEVTFYAKAGTSNPSHPIWVFLQQTGAPWVGYGWYNPTIPNDNTWRRYRFVFTSDYTDNATNLEFEFAQSVGEVWIDNVSIRPMSYTVPKLYNGTYSSFLSPMPANTKQSPPVPNPVTVNGADVTYENLGISPLYSIDGLVYIDANKSACYEPAYDPLYAGGGTSVSIQDPLPTGSGGTGTTTYTVTNGLYNTGITLHAGTYSVTYAAPTPYLNYYPPVGFSVTVGHPGKSVACDTTLAQNVACW